MKSRLNIAIFGIGAVGTLFSSRLSSVAQITLFGHWIEQIEALRRDGLTVTELDGRQAHYQLQATNSLNEIPPADAALILVKSQQTTQAAHQAAGILKPDGIAITLQNGLGNLDKLAKVVGLQRTAAGITAQGATVLGPGRLRHAGEGPTHLAMRPGLEKELQLITDLFNQVGLEAHLIDNADGLIWGKLAVNAGLNPLTALLEVPNGALVQEAWLEEIMSAAANEVAQVAAAQGITLPFADAAQHAAAVSRATANNRSSMLQDVSRQAPTEIDAICGAVVRVGRQWGVPTPVNEFLLAQVKDKEAGRYNLAIDEFQELALQLVNAYR